MHTVIVQDLDLDFVASTITLKENCSLCRAATLEWFLRMLQSELRKKIKSMLLMKHKTIMLFLKVKEVVEAIFFAMWLSKRTFDNQKSMLS